MWNNLVIIIIFLSHYPIMKILSNFDTHLEHEVVSKYAKLYGKDNIFCIHRAKIFRAMYCVVPSIWIVCLIIILCVLLWFDSGDPLLNSIKSILLSFAIASVIFVWWRKILKRYFDYKMDFCIITPQEVAAYNQHGFLSRSSRTIDADKIKTVSVNTSGMWKSLFNFGDIIFLSEWDQEWEWDIKLNFVHNVNYTKNKVRDLIEPHLQKVHNHEHNKTQTQTT